MGHLWALMGLFWTFSRPHAAYLKLFVQEPARGVDGGGLEWSTVAPFADLQDRSP